MSITYNGVTYVVRSEEDLDLVLTDIEEQIAQREAIRRGHLAWHPKDEPLPQSKQWRRIPIR